MVLVRTHPSLPSSSSYSDVVFVFVVAVVVMVVAMVVCRLYVPTRTPTWVCAEE